MIELVAHVILLVCLGMASCDFSYMDFDEGMHCSMEKGRG